MRLADYGNPVQRRGKQFRPRVCPITWLVGHTRNGPRCGLHPPRWSATRSMPQRRSYPIPGAHGVPTATGRPPALPGRRGERRIIRARCPRSHPLSSNREISCSAPKKDSQNESQQGSPRRQRGRASRQDRCGAVWLGSPSCCGGEAAARLSRDIHQHGSRLSSGPGQAAGVHPAEANRRTSGNAGYLTRLNPSHGHVTARRRTAKRPGITPASMQFRLRADGLAYWLYPPVC
jgi:hypothetical protein